jgi:small-conductance mechanosensitive channel
MTMVEILELVIRGAVIFVGTFLIEEFISTIIKRAAKIAGASSTVIRDFGASMRVLAVLVIIYGISSLAGLASEFTALTISGIGALTVSLALQNTLSNVISGILLL